MTPREALEPLLCLNGNGPIKNGPVIASIDAILTALAPHLIPEGCKVVCRLCGFTPVDGKPCLGHMATPISAVVPCHLKPKATP